MERDDERTNGMRKNDQMCIIIIIEYFWLVGWLLVCVVGLLGKFGHAIVQMNETEKVSRFEKCQQERVHSVP